MTELDDARAKIKPLEPTLVRGLTGAAKQWEMLLQEHPDCFLSLDTTTRAGFMHNKACAIIEQDVENVSYVTIPEKLDFFALLIEEGILLRVKFLGDGTPRNYPTKQQQQLARQQFSETVIEALDGVLTPPTLLTCGYTMDAASIGRIEIRRDCVGQQPWAYEIYGGEAVAEPLIFQGMKDTTKPAIVTSTRKKATEDDKRATHG